MKEKAFSLFIFDLYLMGFKNTQNGFIVNDSFLEDLIEYDQITYEENIEVIKLMHDVKEEKVEGETQYNVNADFTKELSDKVSAILSKILHSNYELTKFINEFDESIPQLIADYASDFVAFIEFKYGELEPSPVIGVSKNLKQ